MLTKYNETDLKDEITSILDDLQARNEVLAPQWVTHAVCRKHLAGLAWTDDRAGDDELEPIDVAFWRYAGYTLTRKIATVCINKRIEDPTATDVATLPGFKWVRQHYVVTRDGVDVGVPTGDLTIPEIYGKAMQYERNSVTLAEHARELRRYAAMREAQAPLLKIR